MGILQLLIRLEEIGCPCIAKDQDRKSVVYGLDERGKTPQQVRRMEKAVMKLMQPHKEMLLRFLAPMQTENFYELTTEGEG